MQLPRKTNKQKKKVSWVCKDNKTQAETINQSPIYLYKTTTALKGD